MKTVSSRHNPLFKRIREAIREHDEEIVIEGPKQVADAVAGGWKPITLVTRGDDVPETLLGSFAPMVAFTPDVYDAVAETRSPQSVLGLFERPRATLRDILDRPRTIAVALDGVQDPGNVGTIIRLAAAFDAAGVLLLPGCADPYGPKAIRSSVGSILDVRVTNVTAEELVGCGWPLLIADGAGAAIEPPSSKAVLVFGNEGHGGSEQIREAATPIAVAMSSRVESLNVAASAAILLARSYSLRG